MFPNHAQLIEYTKGLSWGHKKAALIEWKQPVHCENPECDRLVRWDEIQAHHGILKREKGNKIPETPLNMLLTCGQCNFSRVVDNMKTVEHTIKQNTLVFGKPLMREWFSTWPELWKETRAEIWNMMERNLA